MNNKIRSIAVLLILQLLCIAAYSQISLTTSNTATVCFNDGTLTVNASGGVPPYTYVITAGPSNPNISYPIDLPFGQNVFTDLPHGTFTVVVTDGSGNSAGFSASVGGTYEFPSLVFDTIDIPGIICIASGGLPPYQYSISSTSSNSGFGPYQSSDSFADICPGLYWLRVRDSCQNIFTNLTTFSYGINDIVQCVNYSQGTLNVQAYGGHPPYTYNMGSATNTTGNFTGLGSYFQNTLNITDSCGISSAFYFGPDPVSLYESCTTDSNIYISGFFGYDTLTFICTNCSPPQTVTYSPFNGNAVDTLFQHTAPGQNYNIVILSPNCGGDTIPYSLGQNLPTYLYVTVNSRTCNSIQVAAPEPLDSTVLYDSIGDVLQVSYTGYFFQLPNGNYTITSYGSVGTSACYIDSFSQTLSIPMFPYYCESMMQDSGCQSVWQLGFSEYDSLFDSYSMIYAAGDTVAASMIPGYGYNTSFLFNNLQPGGTYTLISDSGCSEQVILDPMSTFSSTAISYVPCVGLPTVVPTLNNSNAVCSNFYFNAYLGDSMINYTMQNNGGFNVTDSGWYTIKWFAISYDTAGNILPYDTLCAIDSNLIYVSTSHIPYPYPSSAYVCDSNNTDTVIYHIYGGDIPYTVEVLGYDTVILNTNTGTFPTNVPGQYTMIVYDNCGISRSITFSVIDTCQGCPIGGISMPDTLYCVGDTVQLINASLGAVAYEWFIDGAPYSSSTDTSFIVTAAGRYAIMLRVYGHSGCMDSGVVAIDAVSPLSVSLGADTSFCDTFTRVLSTGIASTVWSTGQTGPQITVTTPGTYSAMVFNKCGAHADTIIITADPAASLMLSPALATICSSGQDTVILSAWVDSSRLVPFTFSWGGAQVDSSVYSATYLADSAGTYQVTIHDSLCSTTRVALIMPMTCDSDSNIIARPTGFTPNGDGKNDFFYVPHTGDIYSFSIAIDDHWGQQVYYSTNINDGWDGTYRGNPQPEGAYVWFMCYQQYSTSKQTCISGTVMLLR